MNATRSRLGTLTASALVLLALGVTAAEASPAVRDEPYRSARLDIRRPITIAVLPAVALVDDPDVERLVEQSWVALYSGARTRWVPADEVRTCLAQATGEAGDVSREMAAQVWRSGEVDPSMAGRLAALLRVDAVMSVRITRWEIVDGGRAIVEMMAVLSGADGTRLWSISGFAGYGAPRASAEQNFNMDMSWIRNPALEPQDRSHRLNRALRNLLGRWAWSLPQGSLYEDQDTIQMLALNHGE
jgi:hypothetical protein